MRLPMNTKAARLRLTTFVLAAVVTLSISVFSFAKGGADGKTGADRGGKQRVGDADGERRNKQKQGLERGQGKRGQGKQGQAGDGREGKDPAQTAQRMIESHDRNGDGALNAQELAAALTAKRERRQDGGRAGEGGGKGAAKGAGARGEGKRPQRGT